MYIQNRETRRYRKQTCGYLRGESQSASAKFRVLYHHWLDVKLWPDYYLYFFRQTRNFNNEQHIKATQWIIVRSNDDIVAVFFFFCFYLIFTQILKCFKNNYRFQGNFFLKNVQGIFMKSHDSPNGNIFCNNYSTT